MVIHPTIYCAVLRIPLRSDLRLSYISRATNRNKPPTLRALFTSTCTQEMIKPFAETKAIFMSSPHFAVVGASKDEHKVGTKVGFMVLGDDRIRFLNVMW